MSICIICPLGTYNDGVCRPCNDWCATCLDGTNLRCEICADGYYKHLGT